MFLCLHTQRPFPSQANLFSHQYTQSAQSCFSSCYTTSIYLFIFYYLCRLHHKAQLKIWAFSLKPSLITLAVSSLFPRTSCTIYLRLPSVVCPVSLASAFLEDRTCIKNTLLLGLSWQSSS